MTRHHFSRRRYRSKRWSGCRGVTNRIIDIVVDLTKPRRVPKRAWRLYIVTRPGGRKRPRILFGNRDSDHWVGNKRADAVDFRLANRFDIRDKVMHRLGVDGPITDYNHYNIVHNGKSFRVQPIAQEHGSGPHLHMGVHA